MLLWTIIAIILIILLALFLYFFKPFTESWTNEACVSKSECDGQCSSTPSENPFDPISKVYVNPTLARNIDNTIKTHPELTDEQIKSMNDMKQQPSAYWIDVKEKINLPVDVKDEDKTLYAEGIMDDAIKSGFEAVCFIVYDLPNRDCHALSSNGQICCITGTPDCTSCNSDSKSCDEFCSIECQAKASDCNNGLEVYKKQYIDPLTALLKQPKYDKIRKILIIEPDSLPNCTISGSDRGCTPITCNDSYIPGINYAVTSLNTIPNVFMYLDSGHNNWLGWKEKNDAFMGLLQKVPTDLLRGIAMNVSNYQYIGSPCAYPKIESYDDFMNFCKSNSSDPCCQDPCNIFPQYNAANNLMNYVQILSWNIERNNIKFKNGEPHFVIDSGRNGNTDNLGTEQCKTWCNLRDAKAGTAPTTKTDLAQVDALFWLKTPGESDGCIDHSQQQTCQASSSNDDACKRYDHDCNSAYSIGSRSSEPCPPEAGKWFDYAFIGLNTPEKKNSTPIH